MIPGITESTAVDRANTRELKNKTGSVLGVSIVNAPVQVSNVKCPSLAIGDADQKLPKTKNSMGSNISNPIIVMRAI